MVYATQDIAAYDSEGADNAQVDDSQENGHASTASDVTASDVKEAAASGSFRALALWLNLGLVDQDLYAQVQADRPGRLRILVEYRRPPLFEPLTRYICHRIWQLNSDRIEGIYLLVRPLGQAQVVWARSVRIVTPALKQQRHQASMAFANPQALPPQLAQAQRSRRRSRQRSRPFVWGDQQLKAFRTVLLSGSAVAAFVLGCLTEVILANTGPSLPRVPQSRQAAEPTPEQMDWPEAVPVTYETTPEEAEATHPNTVQAALEPVAVIPHRQSGNPGDPTITLLFGGDVSFEQVPYAQITPEQPWLAQLSDYQRADVAMVNLGDSLANADTSLQEELHQRQRSDAAHLLEQAGIDIVNLTHEDIMGFGEQGLAETLTTLDRQGLYRVGAGRTEREARRPEILEVKGQRIAYLSYTQTATQAAAQSVAGVNHLELPDIAEDIRALRDSVDWIVVNYRWQAELADNPAHWQTNLARLAIDQGADVVVGHHPSQLQGAEVYKGRPIVYSLGDFIFEDGAQPDHDTAALKVSLRPRQMKVEVVPITVHAGQPRQATGKAARDIWNAIEQASQEFEQPLRSHMVLPVQTPSPAAPAGAPLTPEDSDPAGDSFTAPPPSSQPGAAPTKLERPEPELPPLDWPETMDDTLKDWGPKAAPEQLEFAPVPGDAGLAPEPRVPVPPAGDAGAQPEAVVPEAIEPYGEPLVGPLGQASPPGMAGTLPAQLEATADSPAQPEAASVASATPLADTADTADTMAETVNPEVALGDDEPSMEAAMEAAISPEPSSPSSHPQDSP
ncbi:Capsule biosynthesis protein CapA [Halomicronema hongdechloris C2206]|uniref:Capsule biosynthesis protein CapA n=1 Tax=Halomicronema hongdechloris C2206 TaxID=1641165 RepID=A0A1Z3HIJ6_9CYAN|nr:CapA family protein [Halomicronema hongdechloris]ASC70086.1 Capsule biosynthesis protein CapA [Halomicronema hongdechloris C2206]